MKPDDPPKDQELTQKDIELIVSMVDAEKTGQNPAKKIPFEKFETLVSQSEQIGYDLRLSYLQTLPKYFTDEDRRSLMSPGHAMDHQLTCAVSHEAEVAWIQGELAEFVKENNAQKNPDAIMIRDYLNNARGMSKMLRELYRIDTARRISGVKQDKRFSELGQEKFEELSPTLIASIEAYEERNQDYLSQDFDLKGRIQALKERITNKSGRFYEDVCQEYSYLDFIEYDKFRKPELDAAADRLVTSS